VSLFLDYRISYLLTVECVDLTNASNMVIIDIMVIKRSKVRTIDVKIRLYHDEWLFLLSTKELVVRIMVVLLSKIKWNETNVDLCYGE